MNTGYGKACGNRRRKKRGTHSGLHCRLKLGPNSFGAEPRVFENLEEISRKITSTGTARKQITHETTETFQSTPPANMLPAKSTSDVRRILRTVAVVDQRRCAICRVCVDICAQHAISINENVTIDSYVCNGCGSCIEACPNEAISLAGFDNQETMSS
jgi:heterodisulfide reductase subunit A-like polyferredoxin